MVMATLLAAIAAAEIYSLANATLGVVSTASLAVNAIGQGLALARGRLPKHTIKQVDRLLSNAGIDVDELSEPWHGGATSNSRKLRQSRIRGGRRTGESARIIFVSG
jgi:hypothetical protein